MLGIRSRFLLGVGLFSGANLLLVSGSVSYFSLRNPAIQTERTTIRVATPHTSQVGKGILPCVEDHLEFLDVSWHRYTDVCISLGSWYTWYP